MKGERNMHGLKTRLFDGQRLRVDRIHPAFAVGFVLCVMLGQSVAMDHIRPQPTRSKVAATIDVASKPSPLARQLKPTEQPIIWAGAVR